MKLRSCIFEFIKKEENEFSLDIPKIKHIDFWFSKGVCQRLNIIKHFIDKITSRNVRDFFLVPFSETVRECSYTRNHEFKLYRMRDILSFNPDVVGVFFKKLNDVLVIYSSIYFEKLSDNANIEIKHSRLEGLKEYFDVVLTSPPYGDSQTTVAYGQFSALSNEWLGISEARKIDKKLLGGKKSKNLYDQGIMVDYILEINRKDKKRALEVTSFYRDLDFSIMQVSKSVQRGGKVFYIVGNRTVKKVRLPTDQFVAEKFEDIWIQTLCNL